jgi:acyl-CoA synthetase (AMP-forming)/AMP-acid ligase II
MTTFVLDDSEVTAAALALAAALRDRGCDAGGRVALLCTNSVDFVIARDAVTAVGATLVPVNPKLAPPEVAHVLDSSDARTILVERPLADRIGEREIDMILLPFERTDLGDHPPPSGYGATLIYTSGTTGRPKGCLRTADQERARGTELISTYSLTADDVHLIACPLAHSAPGIFLRAGRAVGATTIIQARFRPEEFLEAVQQHRATFFFLVPTQYERLLALPREVRERYDISSIRAALVAGAPITAVTKEAIINWLGPDRLWEFYGSSETGTVSVLPPAEQLTRPMSVGQPPPGVSLRIVDGEIYVRSDAVMEGYIHAESHRVDGHITVGDLGRLDEDGYLYLRGRKHDMIISGGVNVYPAEVEQALAEHPEVTGAIVFGVTDHDWGEAVTALVAPRHLDEAGLRAFLRERVAAYKIPKRFHLVDLHEIPIGATGKPQRRQVDARYREPTTR